MTPEAIFFDKDGTLFGFEASWAGAFQRFLAGLPPEKRGAVAEILRFDADGGRFLPGSLAIAGTAWEMGEALQPVLGGEVAGIVAEIDRIAAETEMMPVCDLHACLGALRDLCPLGIVTNDSEVPARRHVDRAEIADLFDFLAGFDSGHGAKPGPGPLLAGAKALGVVPGNCLMVGDSLHDLIAGQRAGMINVGVLTGISGAEELAPYAEVVLPDITHLRDWIRAR